MWIDTHLHLDEEQFDGAREAVVQRAADAGVSSLIAVGTTADSSKTCIELAGQFASVFAAVGIQPNYCGETKPDDWEQIVQLAGQAKVVAIGETGLDAYWDHTPFEMQQDYFGRHIELSRQLDLPLVIHMRDCGPAIVDQLKDASRQAPVRGVMHSFTGDLELAWQCLDLGLYISFAGMVTYKKSNDLREVAKAIPNDRILVETDSPYLSPHPKRGVRPNEPALVVHTGECLAEVRGLAIEEMAAQTTSNAKQLFGL